jgi:uncharacterized protein DUF955
MPRVTRAVKEARRLLAIEKVKEPAVPVRLIAEKHAHVLEQQLPDDISGMLVPLTPPVKGKAWAILLNRANAPLRKRFTLAHELGHLVLHNFRAPHADAASAFKVRYRDSLSSDGSVLEEIEANRFAAELLMPENLLIPRLRDLGFDYASEERETHEKMSRLARSFGVSQQALQIRLANLRNEIF